MLAKLSFLVALCLIASATGLSGIMHGFLDGRWGKPEKHVTTAARLNTLPQEVGPWSQVVERELNETAQKLLRCDGYLIREYWNASTGERVQVAVLMGPRGPIAVHTPEICYSSEGTKVLRDRTMRTVRAGDETARFWSLQLGLEGDSTPSLDVWYAWSDGGDWEAAEYPRFWLTDRLYKIQIAGEPAVGDGKSSAEDFLILFLPVLRRLI